VVGPRAGVVASQATKEKGLGALGRIGAAAGTLIGLLAPIHD
jgi:hypothetical protein